MTELRQLTGTHSAALHVVHVYAADAGQLRMPEEHDRPRTLRGIALKVKYLVAQQARYDVSVADVLVLAVAQDQQRIHVLAEYFAYAAYEMHGEGVAQVHAFRQIDVYDAASLCDQVARGHVGDVLKLGHSLPDALPGLLPNRSGVIYHPRYRYRGHTRQFCHVIQSGHSKPPL